MKYLKFNLYYCVICSIKRVYGKKLKCFYWYYINKYYVKSCMYVYGEMREDCS